KEENKKNMKEECCQAENSKLKFKVRFDYKGKPRPARFFFGGRKTEDVAQEIREQQVALWRNIPMQGSYIENIDLCEIYSVYDEEMDEEIAYAPLELIVSAESLEDLLRFIMKEEFRRVEILEPASIVLNNKEMERVLFKMNELMQDRIMQKLRENNR
ncbi:MAG: hypothetical protein ACOX6X_08285, partial [Dethiobacteria bacterium]